WNAAKSKGGIPDARTIFASATVPSAMMKKRTVRLPFQPSRASSGTSLELDAPHHLGGVRAPVVPRRVERERARVDEAASGVGRRRAALAADRSARGLADRLIEAREL